MISQIQLILVKHLKIYNKYKFIYLILIKKLKIIYSLNNKLKLIKMGIINNNLSKIR